MNGRDEKVRLRSTGPPGAMDAAGAETRNGPGPVRAYGHSERVVILSGFRDARLKSDAAM